MSSKSEISEMNKYLKQIDSLANKGKDAFMKYFSLKLLECETIKSVGKIERLHDGIIVAYINTASSSIGTTEIYFIQDIVDDFLPMGCTLHVIANGIPRNKIVYRHSITY